MVSGKAVPREYMRNALYLNTGTYRFMEIAFLANLASSNWTWSVKLSDLDNDGWVDVYFTNGHSRDEANPDHRAQYSELKAMGKQEIEIFRLINLGYPPLEEGNLAFRNNRNLEVEDVSASWGLDHFAVSPGAAFADFDGDGDLDIVVNNLSEKASVYENLSSGTNRLVIRLEGTKSNRFGIGSTIELVTPDGKQIRHLQPVRGYLSQDEPIVHFGLGNETNIKSLTIYWPSGIEQKFENLEVNQLYTITEPDQAPTIPPARPLKQELQSAMFEPVAEGLNLRFTHKDKQFDDYEREPLLPYKLSQLGPGLAVGDVNRDGRDDIYVGGAAGQSGRLFLSEGQGESGILSRFNKVNGPWAKHSAREDMAALFFDSNGDGSLDLYVVSGSNEFEPKDERLQDRLYLGNGKGDFEDVTESALPKRLDSGSVVAANDFDKDGDLDIFVGSRSIPGKYPLVPESRLYKNENGKFEEHTQDSAPELQKVGLVTGAVWSDIDGDGDSDLLVTLDWGPIAVFENKDGKLEDRTKRSGLDSHIGWWNGITSGDIDNDGDMDFVATNLGLNTKYDTSEEHPMRLIYADFDESGTLDLVETEYEHEKEFPIRGRSCSSGAMPFIADKYKTFSGFASATVQDIYTDENLSKAPYHSANYLESSVLINDGNGNFQVKPLKRLAQASPGYGVTLADFDADGHLDIYMNQNFFGPQPETGFFDGGLGIMLRNDGRGDFEPIWPKESGLIVPEDATAVAITDFDLDGWPDLVIATNNNLLKVYRNRGTSQNNPLVIELKGTTGNPQAIGAQVVVTRQDGSQEVREVTAGSGYLSQSTASLHFGLETDLGPERIDVIWPDGKKTVIKENLQQRKLTISHTDVELDTPID